MQVVFRGSVQRTGRLIKDHHFGIGQHHARNGQTLPLTAGQAHTGAPDNTVQSLGQGSNGAVELGDFQRPPASLVGALAAHGQIGAHRIVEQRRVLQDHGHMLTNGIETDGRLAVAGKEDAAGLRRVKPQQQLNKGTFAATAGTDDGHLFARCDGQVEVIQHPLFAIAETQITYLHPDGLSPREGVGTAGILRLISAGQQLVDTCHCPARRIKRILQVQQLLNGADHEPQVAEDRQHLADRQIRKQHR